MYQSKYRSAVCLFYSLQYYEMVSQMDREALLGRGDESLRWLFNNEYRAWEEDHLEAFNKGI